MLVDNKLKIIERFDNYYSGINNKGAFILAINTLVISGMLVGVKDLQSMVIPSIIIYFKIMIGIIIVLSLISMLYTISAIIPYLDSNNKSLWFFNDVANRSLIVFKNDINVQRDDEINDDIDEQIYYLAVGLKVKHKKIKTALILNSIQMFLIGLITYIILL